MERLRVILTPADFKSSAPGYLETLTLGMEERGEVKCVMVVGFSGSEKRLKRLFSQEPDLILVVADPGEGEWRRLEDLIAKIRQTEKRVVGFEASSTVKIVVCSPLPNLQELEKFSSLGVNGWIEDRIRYEFLGEILREIGKSNEPLLVKDDRGVGYRLDYLTRKD